MTTITTLYKTKVLKSYSVNCCGVSTTVLQDLVTTKVVSDLLVDHRVKPFVLTATTRAPQSHIITRNGTGKLEYMQSTSGTCCAGCPNVYCRVRLINQNVLSVPSYTYGLVTDRASVDLEVISRLIDASESISGSVAELDQCFELVYSLYNRALAALQCIQSLGFRCKRLRKYFRKRSPWARLGDLPAAWLEYSFGIRPLVQDLYLIAQSPSLSKVPMKFIRRSLSANVSGVMKNTPYWSFDERLKTYYNVAFQLERHGTQFPSIGNPAEWAWERIPFSFVVDWVYPVSTYIACMGLFERVTIVRSTLSEVRQVHMKQVGYPTAGWKVGDVTGMRSEKITSRALYTIPPYPPMMVKTSDSVGRLLNQVALLGVLTRKNMRLFP